MVEVMWVRLAELDELADRDEVAIALRCSDRTELARAWKSILGADLVPEAIAPGELVKGRYSDRIVLFRPLVPVGRADALRKWPDLLDRLRALLDRTTG